MRYLRIVIIIYALLYLIVGVTLFITRKSVWDWFIILYFVINAGVIITGTFFERSRYHTNKTAKEGWIKTNERFVDHGKLVEVYFHPKTGEREYKEVT